MSTEPSRFPNDQYRKFVESAPDDLKRYMAAGLPLDFSSTHTESGIAITATTRYPFRVVDFGVGSPREKKVVVYQTP